MAPQKKRTQASMVMNDIVVPFLKNNLVLLRPPSQSPPYRGRRQFPSPSRGGKGWVSSLVEKIFSKIQPYIIEKAVDYVVEFLFEENFNRKI